MSANLFTIMPRVLSHFGDELIRNEIIALTELAKNSYDAYAKKCRITFYFDESDPVDFKPVKILIEDDGKGMTRKDITDYWLTVGTDHKKKQLLSDDKPLRIPLGEKGIGRFGVHKLGEKITVITKTLDTKPISFTIDWTKLDNAQSFEDFDVIFEDKNVKFKRDSGLTYIIEAIKGEWTRKKLRDMYRALTALNIRFSEEDCRLITNAKVKNLIKFTDKNSTSDQFTVQVKQVGNTTIFQDLKSFDEIKESACYECDMLLSGNQIAAFQYSFHPVGRLEEKFEPRLVVTDDLSAEERLLQQRKENFKYAALNDLNHPKGLFKEYVEIDLSQAEIGDIYVKLYAFEKTPSVKKETGIGSDVDTYLRENGGIRVYRDGIRVYDYGEKGNDWLGLSSTADIGNKLRNEHVVGYVFLSRRNSTGLIEKTNREGFIENLSYYLFSDALKWAIKYTFLNYRNVDKNNLSEYYSKTSEPVISLLAETNTYIDKNIDDEDQKNILKGYIDKIGKEYKTIVDMLYQSAGLGILSASIIHEIEKLIKEIHLQISASDLATSKLLVRRLESTIKKFTFLVKKTDIKKHSARDIFDHALLFTGLRLENHSINISITGSVNIECSASINHATNVLLNILDNSIYWLNNTRNKKKSIRIHATDRFLDGHLSLLIADNGPGFSKDPTYLVKPFVSTKPYSVGSGLGLYIADKLMNGMKGSLSFPDFDDVLEYFDDSSLQKGAVVALNFKKNK